MQEICSCGALLVEDALFCHRCGKAQRELLTDDEVPVQAPVQAVLPPPPASSSTATPVLMPVSFRNTLAVRISFLVASIASVLDAMPALNWLFIIWSVCAGFVAVFLYRRSSGQTLSIRSGARMGWITGVLNSLIVIVLFTVSLTASSAELTTNIREQIRTMAPGDSAAMSLVDSPYALASVILLMLFMMFLVFTSACVAGGALGARIMREDHQPSGR